MDNKLIPLGNTGIALAKTSSALAITNKLTFNQNRKLVKEIFKKNPQFFVDYTCFFYYPLAFWYNEYFPNASSVPQEFETIRYRTISNKKNQVLLKHTTLDFYYCINLEEVSKIQYFLKTKITIKMYKLFFKSKYYSKNNSILLEENFKNKYIKEINWNDLNLSSITESFLSEDVKRQYVTKIKQIDLFESEKINWSVKMLLDLVEYYEGISFPNENIWSVLEPYVDDDLIEELFGKRDL